ncbi:MAG: Thioredoxin [Promethearchaeota archaeon]|nr:MAG: Thioredoxin [Candidatus Lokiarchaeota archaeon]
MSDDSKLDEIRRKKFEAYMNLKTLPKDIVEVDTPQGFTELVQKYPENIMVIDFWATWCAPCMSFAPIFEQLHQEYGEHFIFSKVNVDANPQIAQTYGITGIPTTLFLKNGQVLRKQVGAVGYQTMKILLDKFKS